MFATENVFVTVTVTVVRPYRIGRFGTESRGVRGACFKSKAAVQ